MRIRRNASKLLGSPFCLLSSQSDFARNEVEDSTGIVCELSSNPWDLLDFEDYISYRNASNLKEEDEDGGILGKAIITQDMVEPISTCMDEALPSITEPELLTSAIEVAPVKKKRGRKKKNHSIEESKIVENETIYNKNYCKKTDGKGWYCKREVEHPLTLCSYHKEQLRTYTNTHSLVKPTCNATEKVDESSSLYYYYDGFGPCNGKRREKVESQVLVYEEEEQVADDDNEEVDNSNVAIAGGDEYDNDDKDHCDLKEKHVKEIENLEEEKKKNKKVHKKRGRKPIKARSLKSLL